jgi:hypothetical protein
MDGILAEFETSETPASSEGCSASRMELYEQIIQTATRRRQLILVRPSSDVLVAEVSRYGCYVQMFFTENLAARFLSQQALLLARTYTNPNEDLPEVMSWLEQFEVKLHELLQNPGVAGQAELQAFHDWVSGNRRELAELSRSTSPLEQAELILRASDLLVSRNSPASEFNQRFCSWKGAIEVQEPGATQYFPKSLIFCR